MTTDPAARRRKRRRPALGTRIAAAGIGGSALFGIIAWFGVAERPSEPPEVAPPVSVVIQRRDVGTSPEPVELRAQPAVTAVTDPGSVAATTDGSG